MKTIHIKIEGMSCGGCVASAQQALGNVDGVRSVQVDLAHGQATVEHTGNVSGADLIAAITDAGYEAQVQGGPASR